MYRNLTKRIMALVLSVCMIAGMVDLSGLTVHAEEVQPESETIIRKAFIEIDDSDITYDGSEKTLSESQITVYEDGTRAVVPSGKYKLVDYQNHINAGVDTARVTVQNVDYKDDWQYAYYSIKQKNIADIDTINSDDLAQFIHDRNQVVTLDGILVPKVGGIALNTMDYELSKYKNNKGTDSTADSWDNAEVTVIGRRNYTGEITVNFTITLLKSSLLKFKFVEGDLSTGVSYTGKYLTYGVKDITYDGEALPADTKFEPHYENNRSAGTAQVWIEITSEGKYKGLTSDKTDKDHSFKILKRLDERSDYKNVDGFSDGKKDRNITIDPIPDQSYVGMTDFDLGDDLVVRDPDYSKPLEEGVDYTAECWINESEYDRIKGEGTGRVKITAVDGGRYFYPSSRTETFKVTAPALTTKMVHIDDSECIYDIEKDDTKEEGYKEKEWFEVIKAKLTVGSKEDDYRLGEDYDVESVRDDKGTTAGTHKLIVKAHDGGRFKAGTSVEMEYKVQPRSLDDNVDFKNIGNTGFLYDGSEKCPKLHLTYVSGNAEKPLVLDVDYTACYSNNINATNATSKALAWAEGKGNFTGKSIEKEFDISPINLTTTHGEGKVTLTEFPEDPKYTYTGNPITPSDFNVMYGTIRLKKDIEYVIHYSENNVDVGRVDITIEGKGNYEGDITGYYFHIVPLDLNSREVSIPSTLPVQEYTGEKLTPEVTIKHNGKTLQSGDGITGDYYLDYGDENANIERGPGKVVVHGRDGGNYTGSKEITFTIGPRNIRSGTLKITHQEEKGDLTQGDHFHQYTGDPIRTPLTVELSFDVPDGNGGIKTIERTLRSKGEGVNENDYDYTLSFDNDTDVGTATVTIVCKPEGNYSGNYTVTYNIKGNLKDDGPIKFVKVEIPEQIYTHKDIVPADAKVTFDTISGTKELVLGKDYEFSAIVNNTDANAQATATINGLGNYYDERQASFKIVPFNLSGPEPAGNNYVVELDEAYTFIDTDKPVQPVPKVTHNGVELKYGVNEEYYTIYPTDDTNSKAGTGKLTVGSKHSNYAMGENGEGRDATFKIEPYDIRTGETEQNITVEGIRDVILDEVLDHKEDNADVEIRRDGSVEMSNLKVMYTPVGLDGTVYAARPLTDDEYKVTYDANDTIGTATITIEGKGNFTGKITKTFRIRADLSSERTQVSIDGCVYSPKGNTPVPVVTYKFDRQTVTLTVDEDYTVEYDGNTNATLGDAKAKVIIHPVYEDDGVTVKGNYTQSGEKPRTAEFTIEQRDLSKALETEENGKDPLLEVTGLVEDGYEYTGSEIVPELHITCEGMDVIAGDNYKAGDYTVLLENNINVFTFEEDENGERGERLMPMVTIEAIKDSEGNYTGNYKNGFRLEFKINPREISKDTINTILWVNNQKYNDTQIPEIDYNNGEEITFPLESDPSKNDIDVTWIKQGQEVPLEEDTDYLVTYDKNRRIGEAEIIISGKEFGNYDGKYKRTFKIMASIEEVDKEEPQYMTLKPGYENVPYGIVAVYPKLEFIDVSGGSQEEAYILEEGKDFEIVTAENQGESEKVSCNNIKVADKNAEEPPTVVVRGIGCYRGQIERTYNITPKDLADDEDNDITIEFEGALNTENYENAFIYTGKPIEPKVKVYNHGQLIPEDEYIVAGYPNSTAISTETQKASVVIKAAPSGNYINQKTFYYNIIKRPIDEMAVNITSGAQVYSRTEKKPEVEVSYVENSQRQVLDKSNYEVTYENNIDVASETEGENAPTIVITGKGSYGGTIRKTFTIVPEPLDESNDDFVITSKDVQYTGLDAATEITVKAKDGTLLEEEKDYVITGYKDNKNAGTAYVTIRGNGNYTGTRDVPFRIIAPDVSDRFVISEIEDQVYTGSPIEPQVRVAIAEGESQIPLASDEYELEYENNTNVGTATVIVRGTKNYGGAKRVTFKITPRSIGTEGIMAVDMVLADIEDQLYTGRGVTPDVSLTRRGQTGQEDELLVLGKDYTLSYLTNVAVGTASVNIIGIGNYTGSIQATFRILGTMNLADVSTIAAQPYTGSAITPKPVVSLAGKTLTEGEDYELAYADNVDAGRATITITGKGWYSGEKKVTFDIARDFSSETIVRGMAAAYTYTGKAITPAVLVEDHGKILSNGVDYTVSYSSNINVGTATVTVTGKGAYSGTASGQFKITAQNIGRATVSKIADQTYNGKAKKPSVSVSSDGITLKSGIDYTVVHVDNDNPGKASVSIKGKGNFTGIQTVNYNIIVPKVTGVKVSDYTNTTITFSWKRNKVVTGYEIYNSKNKRVARVPKNTTLKATVSNLKTGSGETFRVRAYVTKGQYYYSDFVSIKAGTAPKKTKITSIASGKSKQVALKWKKVSGATQYQVYRSTSKNGKYKKIATTKNTSYTDKKATGGKKYYYKIYTGKKVGSKTYYSYSSAKSVTAKK